MQAARASMATSARILFIIEFLQFIECIERLARRHRIGVKCVDSVANRVRIGGFLNAEIKALLEAVLATAGLSALSLKCLASIDVKADEAGLIALSRELDLPLVFFTRPESDATATLRPLKSKPCWKRCWQPRGCPH